MLNAVNTFTCLTLIFDVRLWTVEAGERKNLQKKMILRTP